MNARGIASWKKMGAKMRKFGLTSNSVLVVKEGTELARTDSLDAISEAVQNAGWSNIVVIVAADLKDIEILNETQMNKAGWFKVDQLAKMIKK